MARSISIAERSYAPGIYNQSIDAPQTATGVFLTLTRVNWPNGHVADIGIDITYDNGATWQFLGSAGVDGGTAFGKDGVIETTFKIQSAFPADANGPIVPDQARFNVVVAQNITTAVTLSWNG